MVVKATQSGASCALILSIHQLSLDMSLCLKHPSLMTRMLCVLQETCGIQTNGKQILDGEYAQA